jgi:hypothetical protein
MNSMQTAQSSTSRLNQWTDKRPAAATSPGAEPLSLMDLLWNRLDGMFVGTWASKFTSAATLDNWRDSWAQAFCDEGITPHEVSIGLRALRGHKFPPVIGEFLAACRPQLSPEQAYHEAVEQMPKRLKPREVDGMLVAGDTWSEPAIYWAAARMGTELFRVNYVQLRTRWERVLKIERTKPRPVPQIMRALPPPSPKPAIEPKEQKRIIAELLATVGKPSAKPADGRRTIALSDEDMAGRKRAMAQLLAASQARAQSNEGSNPQHAGKTLA